MDTTGRNPAGAGCRPPAHRAAAAPAGSGRPGATPGVVPDETTGPRPLLSARGHIASTRHRRYAWRSADPPRQPVLFFNPRSGNGRASRAGLDARARERGIEVIVLSPERSLDALVDEAV